MIISNLDYKAHTQLSSNTMATTSNNVMFSCYSEYDDNNNWQIKVYRSDNNGITWYDSNFPKISNYNQFFPSIAIDSGDNIHIVWFGSDNQNSSYAQIKYCTSYDGGKTWQKITNIQALSGYAQSYPQMLIDNNTNILHVVWHGTDNNNAQTQIKYCNSSDGGSTWSFYKNIQIPSATYAQTYPEMAIDSNSVIHIVWYGYDATYTSKYQIKYSKSIDNGSSWIKWTNIHPSASYHQTNPSVTIDNTNKIHICWQGYDSTHASKYQIKYCNSINGSTWSTLQTLTDSTVYNYSAPKLIDIPNSKVNEFKIIDNGSLNYDIDKLANNSNLIKSNNKLHNIWIENNGTVNQLRAKQFNEEIWTSIDEGTALNVDPIAGNVISVKNCTINNEIYTTFIETLDGVNQLRVKKFDGTDWISIDGDTALNIDITKDVTDVFPIVYNNELYLFWTEKSDIISKIHGKKYSDSIWTHINSDLPLNTNNANEPTAIVYNNELYVVWRELLGSVYVLMSKKFNGELWTNVNNGTTLNYSSTLDAKNATLLVYNTQLFLAFSEVISSEYQLRVKKFDGINWTTADNNMQVSTINGINAQMVEFYGQLYIVYEDSNITNTNKHIRLKKYDGTVWVFVDNNTALNSNAIRNASKPSVVEFNNLLYISWSETSDSAGKISQIKVRTVSNLDIPANAGLHLFFSAENDTSINNRACSLSSYNNGVVWKDKKYLTPVENNISNYSLYTNNNNILLTYSSYSAILLQKCGFKKFLIQDKLNIKTYNSITRNWDIIGTVPITDSMFDNYGFNDPSVITIDSLGLLESTSPLIVLKDLGIEYDRPQVRVLGDRKSDYRYRVTMQNIINPVKSWTQYYNSNVNDTVVIPSRLITTANPYNLFVEVEQKEDDSVIIRKGSVTLIDDKPVILATINGSRLDMTIDDPEKDKIQFNIKLNDKKIYPTVDEYTSLVSTPLDFSYVFQTDQIKIGQNNIVTITTKDIFGKIATVTLNFTGIYVGLIFTDVDNNRYSTDKGETLKLLEFGKIKAGDTTNPIKVYLDNQNGFTITNTKVWIDSSIVGGTVQISKTNNPFVANSELLYDEYFNNGEQKEFFVRITSDPSDVPGGGTFKIYTKAEMI